MPNLTFYLSQEYAGRFSDLPAFTRICSDLCRDILAAEPNNIHIIFITVKPGCGHPVYAELFYRLTTQRTPEVMEHFMRKLDSATQQAWGFMARIRCFAFSAPHPYALN
ncbi:TPA: hypothetical protein I8271_001728 [Kluyvera intermedia]|uniref:Uncharacterized protein n=2 Tax=Enterobacteriaceae TaxID=543 RepID=A0AAC8TMC2_9ENTR|nr:hypothetical protein [Phytobacter ursingii]MDU6682794.1 hypothetical protein [Enterobacteriaceae bacterium]HAT2204783.1 hypothetical protein [Kluyvera intermedia]AKL12399.1 hypothetical protein AB182_14270 [Phytobacter ursingii]HAT2515344.1 hypothetical protein [Kluyvera intermedia]HAT2603109.1 hypothetical protein [Kluyvera intermedia]